jgi:hypothetical protein
MQNGGGISGDKQAIGITMWPGEWGWIKEKL